MYGSKERVRVVAINGVQYLLRALIDGCPVVGERMSIQEYVRALRVVFEGNIDEVRCFDEER